MAQSPNVRTDTSGRVRIVAINRPEARNDVDPPTAQALREAFLAFGGDESVDVAVFTGADGAFCAGYDLMALAGAKGAASFKPEGVGPMGPSRVLLDKPVIAAVEGPGVAGGLELALWCDLRIAAEDAFFGVYCRRWGVPLIDGGTVRLPRLIGHSRAMDMILTGRPVRGPEALEFGLANRLVPNGAALAAAVAFADELTRFPQLRMQTDRMSAIRQWGMPIEDALRHEGRAGVVPLEREAVGGATRFAGAEAAAARSTTSDPSITGADSFDVCASGSGAEPTRVRECDRGRRWCIAARRHDSPGTNPGFRHQGASRRTNRHRAGWISGADPAVASWWERSALRASTGRGLPGRSSSHGR